jgi:hypothetical protein
MFAFSKPKQAPSPVQNKKKPGHARLYSPKSEFRPEPGTINLQRKPVCSCEGGCPRCLPLQAKLKIGEPDDEYEREADRVADQVMRMPEPVLQSKSGCPGCPFKDKEVEEPEIQAKPVSGQITPLVQRQVVDEEDMEEQVQAKHEEKTDVLKDAGVHGKIQSIRGAGEPLAQAARAYFEPRFGADFGGVRVHTGARAAQTAGALQARAYTVGKDITFAQNQYSPASAEGERLLAHELAHVVQQNKGDLSCPKIEEGKLQETVRQDTANAIRRQTPGTAVAGKLNKVDVVVESTEVGAALVVPYNNEDHRLEIDYSVPTYKVTVSGSPNANTKIAKDFEAIRFGIERKGKDPKTPPKTYDTVGLAEDQSYNPTWDPEYTPHSSPGKQRVGAWNLYGSFFVHEGSSDPMNDSFGAIGCIEVVNAKKWDEFLGTIENIAGVECKDVNAKKPKKLTVNIKKVKNRPIAKFVQDNRSP